jgi:hypothetical protein
MYRYEASGHQEQHRSSITWIARVLVFAGPFVAFVATRRICIGLQHKDRDELLHDYEPGIIRQLPDGEFIEVHKPVGEDRRAVLEAKKLTPLMLPPGQGQDHPASSRQSRLSAWRRPTSALFPSRVRAGRKKGVRYRAAPLKPNSAV